MTNEPQKATYVVASEKEGVIQVVGDKPTTELSIASKDADKRAIENGSDYIVLKIISKHKKRIVTDVTLYE